MKLSGSWWAAGHPASSKYFTPLTYNVSELFVTSILNRSRHTKSGPPAVHFRHGELASGKPPIVDVPQSWNHDISDTVTLRGNAGVQVIYTDQSSDS